MLVFMRSQESFWGQIKVIYFTISLLSLALLGTIEMRLKKVFEGVTHD